MTKNKSPTSKETIKPDEAEAPAPEVVEKVVEVEKDLSTMSNSELEKLQADAENQKIQNHLAKEREKIAETSCDNCGANLELNPDDYLKKDNKPFRVECKKCEKQQIIEIKYTDEPSTGAEADIHVKSGNYTWEIQDPTTWTDKHTVRWMEDEAEKLKINRSQLNRNEKKLFRVLQLVAKKQKLIK